MTDERPTGNSARSAQHRELRRSSVPRRGLSQVEAAVYIGVSAGKFDSMVQQGQMPKPKRIGGTLVWDIEALDLYFQALPDVTVEPAPQTNYFDT